MNTSLLLGDSIRWILATALMAVIIVLSVMGIFYLFEFTLIHIIDFNRFIYLLLWLGVFLIVVPIFTFTTAYIVSLVMLIVRQRLAFGNIFGTIYLFGIIILLILFWIDYYEFGWEGIKQYSTLNKWAFSLFLICMLGIPKKISDNYTVMEAN